jgi:hypothetical protein
MSKFSKVTKNFKSHLSESIPLFQRGRVGSFSEKGRRVAILYLTKVTKVFGGKNLDGDLPRRKIPPVNFWKAYPN